MNNLSPTEFFEGQRLEAARAIQSGDMEQLRETTRGLALDTTGKKEMTLLWFAIMQKNFEAIRLLVRQGSDPTKQLSKGLGTPAHYALRNKDFSILAALLDGGMSADSTISGGSSLLHEAAGALGASIDHVKLLVERGANLDPKDSLGETPLCEAIDTNQPDRALYLVSKGASVNVYPVTGATAAWSVQLSIDDQQPGSSLRRQFEELRARMIEHGAKFPPDPPPAVKAWMRANGIRTTD